ncbi:diadenosine tetraphosphate (Ap4A) HIT family hydrolase/pimeloyl-ACP methyl ester carboxylesterase [Sphingomonas vulcanisoli]|uniref:Diadenosine tetraphosphate (Ap4A) HIT family hydrolase/pimeloyl-ACP methyl ester carboxylesterase n=1 Tax=Sphingomonas vulcanisoli TaxID=1658060 RepID=A0ABX0TWC7_9SPHN|nr:alpha/beta fold hydrolase [Sphingomonas vulcanisoli]NIJ08697.1 diadenosine tetraphosphate (Ap4A) HIT family hydrolase/pimeloyl-ACP methyl ester carboxylesterase [Sphingomonas vulcanisoli]
MKLLGAMIGLVLLASMAEAAGPPQYPYPPLSVISDPAPDAANPARMAVVQIPTSGVLINGVLYVAAGSGSHPTLLLFHGLPGNEQNLDLAQAARRAGWNVLTLHYRGSWGSPGTYSFAHCVEDGKAALAFLRTPEAVKAYHVNTDRIVIAGHSLGGIVAARVAADDDAVAGTFLIDPWDTAATGRAMADPKVRKEFIEGELKGDMPPLAGTSIDALTDETVHAGENLDLAAAAKTLSDRPLVIIGAERGIGGDGKRAADAAVAAGGHWVQNETWATDHSFSDMRIALAARLVDWLWTVPPRATSFTGPGWSDQNVFERIIRGQLTIAKVYEDKDVLAFMDNHPESRGHVLVISKLAHARNVMEMDPATLVRLMTVARRIAIAERAAFHPTGVVIQQNNGNAQSVPHLHIHVYPAYGDVPSLSTTAKEVPVAELEKVAAEIRAKLPPK